MNPSTLFKFTSWLLIAMVMFLWYSCYLPELGVEQPQVADRHSSFEASVWITGHGNHYNREISESEILSRIGFELPGEFIDLARTGSDRDENWLYFGIKLPQGWEVTDSIPFEGVAVGIFIHSDSLSAAMANLEPPDPGYCWWVSETPEPIANSTGTIEFFPEIHTDGQSGNFFLDYMLGYNGSLNNRRNDDHYIGVGLADTAWVSSPAETGPGSLRAAIDSVNPGGSVLFDFDLLSTINLTDPILIYKDIRIQGPDDYGIIVSGSDLCRVFYIQQGISACFSHIQIENGNSDAGGGMYCAQGSSVQFDHVRIINNLAGSGGGLYCSDNVTVSLKDSEIKGNKANTGGGVFFNYVKAEMEGLTIHSNEASGEGGGIYFASPASGSSFIFDQDNRCNIYGNSASLGFDLYNATGQFFPVIVDTFSVAWPNSYFAFPQALFAIDLMNHTVEQYQQDLYVSPQGNDSNSGLTPAEPKKTITHALTYIAGTTINPNTIHLAPGTYSPSSNGEHFPLYCHSHVSISGTQEDTAILNGEDRYRVFEISGAEGITIDSLTIENVYASGIYGKGSSFSVDEVTIRNNSSYYPAIDILDCHDVTLSSLNCYGNGFYWWEFFVINLTNSSAKILDSEIHGNMQGIIFNNSEALLKGCSLYDNERGGLTLRQQSFAELVECSVYGNTGPKGAGISCYEGSTLELSGCLLKENTAWEQGGAIYLETSSLVFAGDKRSNIYLNEAPEGRDLYNAWSEVAHVMLDTFTVLYPNTYFAKPLSGFTFDILHGRIPQYDQDLYVNPSGSDENTGLTQEDPLKSVTHAMFTICTLSGPHNVHLAPGTYSASSTGEQFPIQCMDSVGICGVQDSAVILDGEDTQRIIQVEDAGGILLKNFSINYGNAVQGGGILALDADLALENIQMFNNNATEAGGGIYARHSELSFQDVSFENNAAVQRGGGIFVSGTSAVLANNTTFIENTGSLGGGMYIDSSFLVMKSGLLRDNQAGWTNPDHSGGGIYCSYTDAWFSDLLIESNQSNGGGGMSCLGCDPHIENVTFLRNEAYYKGGGLLLDAAAPVLFDVLFEENHGYRYGGGASLHDNSDALFLDVEFIGNQSANGGGMYCEGSTPALVNGSFQENLSSLDGAGLFIEQCNPVFSGITLTGNIAKQNGGGLYLNNDARPYIFGSVIQFNQAGKGGGIFNANNADPYLSASDITDNVAYYGGGIFSTDNATLTFDPVNRCNLFFNRAHYTGADLYAEECAVIPVILDTFTVLYPSDFFAYQKEDFEFDIWNYKLEQGEYDMYVSPEGSDNNSGQTPDDPLKSVSVAMTRCMTDTIPPYLIHLAPGIYSGSSTGETFPLFCRSEVWLLGDNQATTILEGDSSQILRTIGQQGIHIADITFRNGYTDSEGGGIYCKDAGITLERATVTGCITDKGGGMYLKGNSLLHMKDVNITGNQARYGSGLYCEGNSVITGDRAKIHDNQTKWPGHGGGLYCYHFTGRLISLSILDNRARKGGGIYCDHSSPVIINTLICSNTADKGGAMYTNFTDSLRIINSTMAGNVAAQGGAVVMSYHSFSEITNSILWQNTNGISLDDGSLRIRHSDLEGGAGGITITGDAWIEWEQSIDTDPLFCSSGEHPFSLAETSPCIDSGTPDTTGLFLPPWDLAGNPRLWDGDGDGIAVIDMGAYEYNGVYVGENEMQVAGCRLQVFPNPSFGISNISYQVGSKQLAVGNHVRLEIYDMKGKEIRTLMNENQRPGEYTVRLYTSGLPAGVYFIRLQAGEQVETVKMVVMR